MINSWQFIFNGRVHARVHARVHVRDHVRDHARDHVRVHGPNSPQPRTHSFISCQNGPFFPFIILSSENGRQIHQMYLQIIFSPWPYCAAQN